MLAHVPSATLLGVDGHAVRVEVHVSNGLPCFTVVGQPDASCREARDRVRAAVQSSGFKWPDRRITVNLAPTDVRKVGARLTVMRFIGHGAPLISSAARTRSRDSRHDVSGMPTTV